MGPRPRKGADRAPSLTRGKRQRAALPLQRRSELTKSSETALKLGTGGKFGSRFPLRPLTGRRPGRLRAGRGRGLPASGRAGRAQRGSARPGEAPPRPASLAPRPRDRLVEPLFRLHLGEAASARNVPQVFSAEEEA